MKVIPFLKKAQTSSSLKNNDFSWTFPNIYKNTHIQGLQKPSPDTRGNKCIKKQPISLLIKTTIRISINMCQLLSDFV